MSIFTIDCVNVCVIVAIEVNECSILCVCGFNNCSVLLFLEAIFFQVCRVLFIKLPGCYLIKLLCNIVIKAPWLLFGTPWNVKLVTYIGFLGALKFCE